MATVAFRFYGPLNDFLDASKKSVRFHLVVRAATVKDAIESLGVPHPEVDCIVINGTLAPFTQLLREGDDIAVYPRFLTIEPGVERLTGDPPEPVRFAADVHLGRLTALLRLAGFDTEVREDDADLAELAGAEQRVALTRDAALLKRAVIRHGRWIRNTNPDRQLAEIIECFGLADRMRPFTRCSRCNGVLTRISREAVFDRIPDRVRARQREFLTCEGCGKIYWPGTHYERIRERLERARDAADGATADESDQ